LTVHSIPDVLLVPREIAETYQYIVHFEDGDFYARPLELAAR
jgi:hypothetical protein